MATKSTNKIVKQGANSFEVTRTTVHTVDKKGLVQEIADLKKLLDEKKARVGIPQLEEQIAKKEALLAEINATK